MRRQARGLARSIGWDEVNVERVALATMELATNLVRYARDGRMIVSFVQGPRGGGIQIESHDAGPGIANIDDAMTDGVSHGGGLGNGLPGIRRLMDEFEIETSVKGTSVVARRWAPPC